MRNSAHGPTIAGILASLCGSAAALPSPGSVEQYRMPIGVQTSCVHNDPSIDRFTLDVALGNDPIPGGVVELSVTITTLVDVPRLEVLFETTGIADEAPPSVVLTDVTAGVGETFTVMVGIGESGFGHLRIVPLLETVDSCGVVTIETAAQPADVQVIADDGEVVVGTESKVFLFSELLQDRVDGGALGADAALSRFKELVTTETSVEAEEGPGGSAGGSGATVSGRLVWLDSAGNLQPARLVPFLAEFEGTLFDPDVASGTTDTDGRFTINIEDGDVDADPEELVITWTCENRGAEVTTDTTRFLGLLGGVTYTAVTRIPGIVDGFSNSYTVTIPSNRPDGTSSDAGRAFSVLDSALTGSDYIAAVNGSPLGQVTVRFPTARDCGGNTTSGGSFYCNNTDEIHIDAADSLNWDVLCHEYGHYVEDQFALTQPAGGFHFMNVDLVGFSPPAWAGGGGPYSYTRGTNLAWSEGLATYLMLAAHRIRGASIAGTNDTLYSFSGGGTPIQLEGVAGVATGEGCETNVTTTLYDIADSANETQPKGKDELTLGHNGVWASLTGRRRGEIAEFWTDFSASLSNEEKAKAGCLFAMNQVAPEVVSPADKQRLGRLDVPSFAWSQTKLNDFKLRFFDDDWNQVDETAWLGNVSRFPRDTADQSAWDATWASIAETVPNDIVRWVLIGRNDNSPSNDEYWSCARELELRGVDFAFVVDDTGSMSQEIGGVRDGILSFLSRFDAATNEKTFMLITFKDSVTTRSPTDDLTLIQSQVASLTASGGANCPEASVQALQSAGTFVKRGGTVDLHTDADWHSGADMAGTVADLRSKGIRVNSYITDTCSGAGESSAPGGAPTGNAVYVADLNDDGLLDGGDIIAFVNAFISGGRTADLFEPYELIDLADLVGFVVAMQDEVVSDQPAYDPYADDTGDTSHSTAGGTGYDNSIDGYSQLSIQTGGVFNFIPELNSGSSGARERYIAIVENVLGSTIEPRVVAVRPERLPRGGTAGITIEAQRATFTTDSVVEISGGMEVLETQLIDNVTLRATVAIDPDAGLGFQDIVVTTPLGDRDEVAFGVGLVNVTSASGRLLVSATPAEVFAGQTTQITLFGLGTSFTSDAPLVDFGFGITIDGVTVISDTELLVDVSVDEVTPSGFRRVDVTSDGSTIFPDFADNDFFLVTSAPTAEVPSIVGISPPDIRAGNTAEVVFEVANLELDAESTTLEISGLGVSIQGLEVCTTELVATIEVDRRAASGVRDVIIRSGESVIARPDAIRIDGLSIGDVNADGVVNLDDLEALLAAIGTSAGDPGYIAAADLNFDGYIGIDDFEIWYNDFAE